jgi:hypothetical protein
MVAKLVIGVAALALLGFSCGLVYFGEHAAADDAAQWSDQLALFVMGIVAVSLLHVGACVMTYRVPPRLEIVLLVALAARLIVLFGPTTGPFGGDMDRVQIEAAQVDAGLNPYEFRVSELMETPGGAMTLQGEEGQRFLLAQEAVHQDGMPALQTIEQPDLRSTQTPLAQWIGVLAERSMNDSRQGYAFLALLADALAIFLLVMALMEMGKPVGLVMIYAWSPVLLHEVYGAMAVDVFVLPGIAGVIFIIAKGRKLLTVIPFALAAAIRPVMLLLLPLLWRRLGMAGVLLLGFLMLLPVLPFLATVTSAEPYLEGPLTVLAHDAKNSLFVEAAGEALAHVPWKSDRTVAVAGVTLVSEGDPLGGLLARAAALLVMVGVLVYASHHYAVRRNYVARARAQAAFDALLAVVAGFLFVSPVLEPSYALWLLPLLVVRPALSWMALPAFLCLAYLRDVPGLEGSAGRIPIPVLVFGAFMLFWVLDLMWRQRLFGEAPAMASDDEWSIDAGEFAEYDGDSAPEEEPKGPVRMIHVPEEELETF